MVKPHFFAPVPYLYYSTIFSKKRMLAVFLPQLKQRVSNGEYYEYPYISDFKKRVLNPAIKEINIKASIDINCYYKLEKTEGEGNQYKYIQLYAKSQTKELLPDFSI